MRFTEVRSLMLDKNCKLPIWLKGIKGNNKMDIAKCVRYCQKTDTGVPGTRFLSGFSVTSDGVSGPSMKGKRSDILSLRTYLESTKGTLDILSSDLDGGLLQSIAQYPRFTAQLQSRLLASDTRPVAKMICLWGESGTGKTARAHLIAEKLGYKPQQIYVKEALTQWWDGYDPSVHRVVVVDEMRPCSKEIAAMYLAQMTPGKVTSQQAKGGFTPLIVDVWIFTSPFHPESWIWCPEGVDKSQQFVRRFQPHIYHFEKPYTHPNGNIENATDENITKICLE